MSTKPFDCMDAVVLISPSPDTEGLFLACWDGLAHPHSSHSPKALSKAAMDGGASRVVWSGEACIAQHRLIKDL